MSRWVFRKWLLRESIDRWSKLEQDLKQRKSIEQNVRTKKRLIKTKNDVKLMRKSSKSSSVHQIHNGIVLGGLWERMIKS